jgi:hypothetical protein
MIIDRSYRKTGFPNWRVRLLSFAFKETAISQNSFNQLGYVKTIEASGC